MNVLVIILTVLCVKNAASIPILSHDDTKLDSIVISEIDLPTESSLLVIDQEISKEPESSFHELIEKYDETYIKNLKDDINIHKRSSSDEEENLDAGDVGGKSIIEKVHIHDPDVRKEFENELSQNQILEDENEGTTEENTELATVYEPNYERKMIVVSENSTEQLTVQEKENLQVHLVEQLVHQTENDSASFTTIVPDESFVHPEIIKNPAVVEVLEHIVYESDSQLRSHEHTTLNPIVQVKLDVDPIEIIPKDRHRLGRDDNVTESNDKFAGFVGIPTEDLIQPGDETTEPDSFFKKKDDEEDDTVVDTLRETLEYVAIYGKSLDIEPAPTTLQPATEIVEVNTQISVNVQVGGEMEAAKSSSSEEADSSQQSSPSKSSEEDDSKGKRRNGGGGGDSSEENSGREIMDDDLKSDLRSLEFPASGTPQRTNELPEEAFKNAPCHEIKKKDHPTPPLLEAAERKFDVEGTSEATIEEDNSLVVTMTAFYETVEEISTTISDGVKLTSELRHSIESFRDDSEENKIVLDTMREAISSKNSKVPLVGVNEMMTLKNRSEHREESTDLALAVIPCIAIGSAVILIGLFKLVKGNASAVAFY
jgi:hypothetical protein